MLVIRMFIENQEALWCFQTLSLYTLLYTESVQSYTFLCMNSFYPELFPITTFFVVCGMQVVCLITPIHDHWTRTRKKSCWFVLTSRARLPAQILGEFRNFLLPYTHYLHHREALHNKNVELAKSLIKISNGITLIPCISHGSCLQSILSSLMCYFDTI